MPRQISYRWRPRELMASRGMFTVTELMPHPSERGISLSASQDHRLVFRTQPHRSADHRGRECGWRQSGP
jgi:hypothetical protein